MVKVSMSFTDPKPGFQGHGILKVEYPKSARLMGKVTVAH